MAMTERRKESPNAEKNEAKNHKKLANALRALAMDAVQKANSGHPGMPMGMADIAEVLWNNFLSHNPANPAWINRDRFVLSNGHGSMLLYGLLHLSGYDLPLAELKNFRQLHSKTPGHPEYGLTPGVETTTGPLGQGLANAVGMALAEKILAARFNIENEKFDVINHYTYAFCGDGCLMEGISHEVCSLAGTWGLNKLIVFYDDNGISIDGPVQGWFTEDIPQRFKSYGWQVIESVNGHDPEALTHAIKQARKETSRPSLICCKTQIAYGSPNKANTADSHGSPLGEAEITLVREKLDWPYGAFEIPEEIYDAWNAKAKGRTIEAAWDSKFAAYAQKYPELAAELKNYVAGDVPQDFRKLIHDTAESWVQESFKKPLNIATRKASQLALNAIAPAVKFLLGGSADLTGSNNTNWSKAEIFSLENPKGDYVHYGVREFGMSAIMNGIALHGGLIPFGGTFLVFTDYARNAIRMSALMRQRVIYIMTHDSIGLGEDGPTHQPVEHLASLRLIPNLEVWRPAGPLETLIAWEQAIERKSGPSVLALSRQNLPFDFFVKQKSEQQAKQLNTRLDLIRSGGYVARESATSLKCEAILIATGSELELAMKAAENLENLGIGVRVVSMPCVSLFVRQAEEYRVKILPVDIPAVVIEAGVSGGWYALRSVKAVVGLESFGESAPAKALYEYFGITLDGVIEKVKCVLMDAKN
jgi:transketolase